MLENLLNNCSGNASISIEIATTWSVDLSPQIKNATSICFTTSITLWFIWKAFCWLWLTCNYAAASELAIGCMHIEHLWTFFFFFFEVRGFPYRIDLFGLFESLRPIGTLQCKKGNFSSLFGDQNQNKMRWWSVRTELYPLEVTMVGGFGIGRAVTTFSSQEWLNLLYLRVDSEASFDALCYKSIMLLNMAC